MSTAMNFSNGDSLLNDDDLRTVWVFPDERTRFQFHNPLCRYWFRNRKWIIGLIWGKQPEFHGKRACSIFYFDNHWTTLWLQSREKTPEFYNRNCHKDLWK
jgi:hypothetical protein